MPQYIITITLIVLISCVTACDAISQDSADVVKGWGRVFDPDRDCQVKTDGKTLIVTVPGSTHDLSSELGKVNAPRVLRDVQGDFIADVTVAGTVRPSGKGTVANRLPFNGAGILVWIDEKNHARLERAAILQDGRVVSYVMFEVRQSGQPYGSPSFAIEDKATQLRLERRGDQILGSVSSDGVQWRPLKPLRVNFPTKVGLGVAAVNTTTQPFVAEFTQFAIYGRLPE